jgi:hypothetical protein
VLKSNSLGTCREEIATTPEFLWTDGSEQPQAFSFERHILNSPIQLIVGGQNSSGRKTG